MAQSHYSDTSPASASSPGWVRLSLNGRMVDLMTDRGVFSPHRLDRGTSVLLRHLGSLPEGPLVDLGCGYGPIAVALALAHPEQEVWALDVNERALALAAANASALGLANLRTAAPDAVPAHLRPAGLYSNPPIRIGKAALHELLTLWLERMAPTGTARLVVQKHLGSDSLARWLTEAGYPTRRVISEQSYRVLEVKPRGTTG
jgi:16S rRNA (guanine1207-N2)-methyltransferase